MSFRKETRNARAKLTGEHLGFSGVAGPDWAALVFLKKLVGAWEAH